MTTAAFLAVVAAHAALLLTWSRYSPPQYTLSAVQPMVAGIIVSTVPTTRPEPATHPTPPRPRNKPAPLAARADAQLPAPAPDPETPAETTPANRASRDQPAVIPPRFDAAYLDNPPPNYPPLSRRLGEQGRVLVRAYVEPAGQPSHVELGQSSRYPRLDSAALEAVRRWRFVPARRGEQPVGAWVVVPVVFNLRS